MRQRWQKQYKFRYLNLVQNVLLGIFISHLKLGSKWQRFLNEILNLSWDDITLFFQNSKGVRSIDDNLNSFSGNTRSEWTRNHFFQFTWSISRLRLNQESVLPTNQREKSWKFPESSDSREGSSCCRRCSWSCCCGFCSTYFFTILFLIFILFSLTLQYRI